MDKYTDKKKRNQDLTDYISKHISPQNFDRILSCGTYLEFYADRSLEVKKLNKANFCGNRFCPLCSWRKARKDAFTILILMEYLKQEHNLDFIMLTLTAPNVSGENLKSEITRYNKCFRFLTRRKEFKALSKGYVRKLEVTYNAKRDDFHPHFHVIIAVKKSYFTSKEYLSKKRWLALWREVMNDDSITQVDVRKVNTDDTKAISEIAKYSAKDSDYMTSDIVFDAFYKALKGRQLITYADAFKNALTLFKRGELDKYKEIDLTEYVYRLIFDWNKAYADYILYEMKELSEKEIAEINKKTIEDMEIDE